MSGLDANINDFSAAVNGPSFILPIQTADGEFKLNPALSTIEQSKLIASLMTPSPNAPLLFHPSNDAKPLAVVVSAMENNGKALVEFLRSMEDIENETINKILENWNRNLEEIEAYVKSQRENPNYQYQLDVSIKGDPKLGNVSGIQSPISANAAAANPSAANETPYDFLNAINKLKIDSSTFERVPNITQANESPDIDNHATKVTMLAVSIIAGGLALTTIDITPTSITFSNPMQLVERLQPVFPQINVENIIPMINLMVALPIYGNALIEAIGNKKEREGENHLPAIQNFAASVLKMVSDPAFVMMTFVNKMNGADKMSPENKEQMGAMLKLILASVALSLLYSADVGKVQAGKFWGMEPQEFRDLLSGAVPEPDPAIKQTKQQMLVASLIKQVNAQLAILPQAQKEQVIETLLAYVGSKRDLDKMMDPVKVLTENMNAEDPTKSMDIQSV
ncbi:MAG: hypothetical protein H0V82_04150 [Candidatus Protochlamydia sp.]|nr:hypothetical protein [Candidatus Protochlamydia sp.]